MRFTNLSEVRSNMSALIAFARKEAESGAFDRLAYVESLNLIQRYQLRFSKHGDGPLLDFSLDHPQTSSLLQSIYQPPEFDPPIDVHPVALEDIPAITDNFRTAQALLREYSPEIAQISEDLVAWIIFTRLDGYDGGSTWHTLGAIWMSPDGIKPWTTLDYAENLLHETMHQVLFLDEMVHRLFEVPPPELSRDSALVTSSIRETKRPYHYAFHAAVVSAALIDFHEHVGDAQRALRLCQPLVGSLNELDEKKYFLSSRGNQILADMIQRIKSSPTLAALNGACNESIE